MSEFKRWNEGQINFAMNALCCADEGLSACASKKIDEHLQECYAELTRLTALAQQPEGMKEELRCYKAMMLDFKEYLYTRGWADTGKRVSDTLKELWESYFGDTASAPSAPTFTAEEVVERILNYQGAYEIAIAMDKGKVMFPLKSMAKAVCAILAGGR